MLCSNSPWGASTTVAAGLLRGSVKIMTNTKFWAAITQAATAKKKWKPDTT